MNLEEFMNYLLENVTSIGFKLLGAIAIVVIGMKLISILKKFLRTSPRLNKVDESLRSFMVSFVSVALYSLLFVTVALIIGVPAASFIAILTTCGAAIGLALQGSLSNFAGGIMILLFKPFKVGDYIEAAGEEGIVNEISVVYTEILTYDNRRITIPNGTLTNSVIENYTAEKIRRVDLTFDASYENDVDEVKKVISKVIEEHPLVLKNPDYFVRLSDHADNSLTYTVRAWCETANYWDVYFDIIENVKKAFDENNIKIPYNQIDVHMDNK